ncbi:ORF6N domain-containing protein [Sphingobacterium sp. SGR-19]|uniref:ORF6N domain-containing protein n=1 Tax=Sphingobacterium sp. SGR-19 TaxID=2710886 RepID=UPI0013EC1E67|nr:ORF6N domain-containing protein [Sphingobacterium sp. SGR-19]NGM65469.1 ORF6N domain-containing protein [Sphingobacterium sp. SGR-19]
MRKTKTELKAIAIADDVLANKIYEFRGQKVMLDSDLAELYGVETKRLNEQVRRNASRFPDDFMFNLSNDEIIILKSQIATSSWGGRRKAPNVFTEHGVLMLSSVLHSEQAIQVNIQIMRIFAKIRQYFSDNTEIKIEIAEIKYTVENIAKKQKGHDQNIELLFEYIDRLQENAPHTSSKGVTVVKGFDVGSKKNN